MPAKFLNRRRCRRGSWLALGPSRDHSIQILQGRICAISTCQRSTCHSKARTWCQPKASANMAKGKFASLQAAPPFADHQISAPQSRNFNACVMRRSVRGSILPYGPWTKPSHRSEWCPAVFHVGEQTFKPSISCAATDRFWPEPPIRRDAQLRRVG